MSSQIQNEIANVLEQWSNEKIIKAKGILTRYGAIASENLSASLMTFDVKVLGDTISIGIGFVDNAKSQASEYYKYADEGVKGIGGGKSQAVTTGRFSYKNAFVSKKMVSSIQSWIGQKGIQVRTSNKQKTSDVIKRSESLAYVIAKSIKRTGIGKTMFWSDTFNQKAYDELVQMIEDATGKSYSLTFKDI